MHLAQLRHEIARPVFGVTSIALREYQRALCRDPQLQSLGMVIGSSGSFGAVTLATPTTAAVLLLGGLMLHTSRFTVGERVARMWHARRLDEPLFPGQMPIRPGRAQTLGNELRKLLMEEVEAASLMELNYVPELATATFRWGPGMLDPLDRDNPQLSQTTYVSQHPADQKMRAEALDCEPVRTVTSRSLRGIAVIWVARMIETDLTGVSMPDSVRHWQTTRVAEETEP